jgi:hypothetical protein
MDEYRADTTPLPAWPGRTDGQARGVAHMVDPHGIERPVRS